MTHDFVLTEDRDGRPIAHRLDCPVIARERALGRPICTLLACERPLPADFNRHACLVTRISRDDMTQQA